MNPPVLAYHLIMTAYGFWLPNDPRGSWSDVVRARELLLFGPATKVTTQRSLAKKSHNHQQRLMAKRALAREAAEFTGIQARAIARGFAIYCQRSSCIIHACAILRTHCHLVIARHTCAIEQIARLLKGAATAELGLHPFQNQPYRNRSLPTPWARHQWSVFLDSPKNILRAIRYVNDNPIREEHRVQNWSCVRPYLPA
jgi:REP element-mobilizing transposase RayT